MKHLRQAIDFKASELLQFDLLLAAGGAVGGALLGVKRPQLLWDNVDTAATLVTAVIGAVLAGVAIQAAFMDQSFLRRTARIGRDPVRYLAPFIFSTVLGVLAALSLLVLSLTTVSAATAWRGTIAGVSGFLSVYTLASLLNGLDTLVQFIGLKADAAALPDESTGSGPQETAPVRRISR